MGDDTERSVVVAQSITYTFSCRNRDKYEMSTEPFAAQRLGALEKLLRHVRIRKRAHAAAVTDMITTQPTRSYSRNPSAFQWLHVSAGDDKRVHHGQKRPSTCTTAAATTPGLGSRALVR